MVLLIQRWRYFYRTFRISLPSPLHRITAPDSFPVDSQMVDSSKDAFLLAPTSNANADVAKSRDIRHFSVKHVYRTLHSLYGQECGAVDVASDMVSSRIVVIWQQTKVNHVKIVGTQIHSTLLLWQMQSAARN